MYFACKMFRAMLPLLILLFSSLFGRPVTSWQGRIPSRPRQSSSHRPRKAMFGAPQVFMVAARDNDSDFAFSVLFADGVVNDESSFEDTFFEDASAQGNGWKQKEISPYYTRDPDDKSKGPIADVEGLREYLNDRYRARQAKNFDRVDGIDEVLKKRYSIRVFDNPNIWTRQIQQPPNSYLRKVERKKLEKLKVRFGPTGHPYRRIGGPIDDTVCGLSMTEIHTLLSRSELLRIEGYFEEHDATLFELHILGVEFCKTRKYWRADGCKDFNEDDLSTFSNLVPTYHEVSNEKTSEPSKHAKRVEQLIGRRAESLVREEHDLAQFIAVELFETYHVGIDDATCTYSFQPEDTLSIAWSPPTFPSAKERVSTGDYNNMFPPLLFVSSIPHRKTDSIHAISTSTEASKLPPSVLRRVEDLRQEWTLKVEERRMLEAVAIQRELKMAYDISVDDIELKWTKK